MNQKIREHIIQLLRTAKVTRLIPSQIVMACKNTMVPHLTINTAMKLINDKEITMRDIL